MRKWCIFVMMYAIISSAGKSALKYCPEQRDLNVVSIYNNVIGRL